MKINGNAIRPGMVVEHQGRLWRAVKIQHTQPGKGGAYLQVELKDLQSGSKLNERFRSSETVERATLEQRDYQYLYSDGDTFTFQAFSQESCLPGLCVHCGNDQNGVCFLQEITPFIIRRRLRVQWLRDEAAFPFHNLNHNHNLTQYDYD